ncbi:MAG TPA: glycosyltransferase family 4 protein [Acidimicrobiales bacterium]|nr:glycosyltransferase family 4 protein [Acidimicrobiales bacterium]
MSVEALLSGRLHASSRFRVLQHVEALKDLGVRVRAVPPRISKYAGLPPGVVRRKHLAGPARLTLQTAKLASRLPALTRSWATDVTWLERELLPGRLSLEPLLHRPLLFDVDDAIWLISDGYERAVRAIASRSACVLAGNDFLADWFSATAPHVERVWTAVDTSRFLPRSEPSGGFTVGWTGSAFTLRYLEPVAGALARFLVEAPEATLVVMADFEPRLPEVPAGRVRFVQWHPETEAEVIRRMDVGIMPLYDDDYARGKCAFKMLQYLATAVPAVVSPVGMAAQVLDMGEVGLAAGNEDEWVDALLHLYHSRDKAEALGRNGRQLVERRFSVPVISRQLAACMRRYA